MGGGGGGTNFVWINSLYRTLSKSKLCKFCATYPNFIVTCRTLSYFFLRNFISLQFTVEELWAIEVDNFPIMLCWERGLWALSCPPT